jgi:diacylglycerol kinase (ATP)
VLIFGGDGTVHHQLARLANTNVPTLIAPYGSGNDFAATLGLRSPEDSLAAWRRFCSGEANIKQIDLGSVTPLTGGPRTYFCEAGGAGIDSAVIQRVNRMPQWLRGHGGYFLATLGALASWRARKTTVSLADATGGFQPRVSEPALTAIVANGSRYGHGMKIAPHADPADGLLDVCFVHEISRWRLPRLLHTIYTGEHIHLPEVEYFQARQVRIETDPPMEFCADGEYVCATPVEISVLPSALRVIV